MGPVRGGVPRQADDGSWQAGWRKPLVLGVALSLLLLALALLLGWREHRLRGEQAALRAELVAEAIEGRLRDRLAQLAEELDEFADFAGAGPGPTRRLFEERLRLPAIRDVVLVHDDGPALDADGRDRPRPQLPPRSDRGEPAGLQLLPPRQDATTLAVVWDGRPGVRVVAAVDPRWFVEIIEHHDLGPGSLVNLVHDSQRLYARSLEHAAFQGRSLREAALFSGTHRTRLQGRYDDASVFGGERRQFVYRRVPDTQLTVVVGTPAQAIAAPAWGFLGLALVIAALLALLWLWLLRGFAVAHHRQERLLGELRHTTDRLRETQSLASIAEFRWDVDTGEVRWSEEAFRLYGRPLSAGQPTLEEGLGYLHPEDIGRARALADDLMAGGSAVTTQFRITRGDGALRWIEARGERVVEDGRVVLQGVQQDITALASVRERLRMAQEIARIGDWEWDIASREILWSDTAYAIYGLDPQAFQPRADTVFQFVHEDDRVRLQGFAAALIDTGERCEAEFRIVRPDGGVRVIHAIGMREIAADGRTIIRCVQQDVTDLALARDRLLETEEQYRFLFEHNPVPMWVFDRETLAILAVNDAMTRHYGYSRAELIGRSMLEIRPPEDRAAVRAAARLRSVDRPQGRVWTHLRRDGTRLRVAVFTHDIDFAGHPARLVAAQDVTEREASEQRFQLVARATSDAIYDLDIESGALWWSDSFYTVFGYAREQVPATLQAWEGMVHPDDLARVNASLGAAIAAADANEWEEEYRFRRHDGTHAVVVDRGFFVREENGTAVRMVGGMLDVSEKRRRDADLRLLSRAIEAVDNGVVIADARQKDLPLVYVNSAFEEMTGYTAAECLGRNCRFLQGGDHDQAALQNIRHALGEQREARAVLRNYRKDGSLFWNELHLAPVHAADGSVTHYVGIQTDVSHRQYYEQELAHRATHDQLTGLPNRQLLMDRLQQAILNAGRYGREAAVVFIDLDDFKLVNDNLDHAAGDEALRVVAGRLRTLVRETDTVGRFGGDEFVVVLTEQTDEDGVAQVIARISAGLSAPMQIGGIEHTLTPSIGWCRYPDGGRDADTLLKHADMAMYQAKRQGRNRAVAYDPGFDAHVSQRLQLVAQLRDALERGEFELVFQPLFDGDGQPVALEALVRWRHPERGLLLPSDFIGVCEESGLIIELGRRTLREAARHHALLAAAGYAHLRLAVNVSALQFGYAIEDDIAALIGEFQLPPNILELEITESVILEHPERAIQAMQRIAALGVCLSVDDFGTGYSSLAYLRRLPIHRLKIDRSFVEDLPDDREAASICDSIIGLAHSLDLRTVGEGVETEAQLRWLRAHGCDEVQGYLLASPAPFDEILARLYRNVSSAPA